MSTVLKTEAITMRFGGVTAVNELKLDIKEHQIVALIGPNGAGKTTAFNMITGVYTPTEGKVKYTAPGKDEVDITLTVMSGNEIESISARTVLTLMEQTWDYRPLTEGAKTLIIKQ